jgi:hypothetical protein
MQPIFNAVARSLYWISSVTGFSYNEINILAYFILLPFVYVALVDRIARRHWLKLIYIVGWSIGLCVIKDFRTFSNRLFDASVDFLLLFSGVGLNYVAASVVICVLLPGIVLLLLVWAAFPSVRRVFGRS